MQTAQSPAPTETVTQVVETVMEEAKNGSTHAPSSSSKKMKELASQAEKEEACASEGEESADTEGGEEPVPKSKKMKNSSEKIAKAKKASNETAKIEKAAKAAKAAMMVTRSQAAPKTRTKGMKPAKPMAAPSASASTKKGPTKRKASSMEGTTKTSVPKKSKTSSTAAPSSTKKKPVNPIVKGRALLSGGIPNASIASKKIKKSNILSDRNAHIKYKARLSLIPAEKFSVLDGCWISIYHPSMKDKTTCKEGVFNPKWTKILAEVSEKKGCHIIGTASHYGTCIKGTNLRTFTMMPQCVEKDKVEAYKSAGYDKVQGNRVFVGTKKEFATDATKDFAFQACDKKADETWFNLKKFLDEDSQEEKSGSSSDKMEESTA